MAIVDPRQLEQGKFERLYRNLRYFAAARATVTVGAYDSEFQICQITFNRTDGSVFVSFPYFPEGPGILCDAKFPEDQAGPITLHLHEGGKVASTRVKYSHHPDGRVHFSQDGKVRTTIIRRSFRLDGPIGHVFQLHVYQPFNFTPFVETRRKADRLYLRYRFRSGLPHAVVVTAEWRRKADVVAAIRPLGLEAGPLSMVQHTATGAETPVFWLGEPDSFPLQDHLLMVAVAPTTDLPDVSEPTMIFMGGYDPHEVNEPGTRVNHTSCLTFMYPAHAPEELAKRLGSIDFVRSGGESSRPAS